MKRAVLVLSLALTGVVAARIGAAKDRRSLIGAWRIVSIEQVQPNGTVKTEWMGIHPVGLIVYDASGYVSAQLGRDPPAAWNAVNDKPSAEDKAKAFDAHYAYFGRYDVDEQARIVTHRIERSLQPTETGITYKRSFEFQGNDRLTLTTERAEDGSYNRLVWERARR